MCVEGPVFLFYFQSIVELYFVKYNKNTLPKKKKIKREVPNTSLNFYDYIKQT